jgi:hypothetical protein
MVTYYFDTIDDCMTFKELCTNAGHVVYYNHGDRRITVNTNDVEDIRDTLLRLYDITGGGEVRPSRKSNEHRPRRASPTTRKVKLWKRSKN